MPTYDYACACGHHFSLLRAIAARDGNAPCARCGTPARRAIGAPRLALLARGERIAQMRNERSAHEPLQANRGPPAAPPAARGPLHAPHHGRPWMLGH